MPRGGIRAKLPLVRLAQRRSMSIFVRVDPGFLWRTQLESFQSCRMHSTFASELLHSPDVECAPIACRFARGETDFIAFRINGLTKAVDPTVAECFVHSFGPGDDWVTGPLFVKTDPLFALLLAVIFEPRSKLRGSGKEDRRGRSWFHIAAIVA